MLNVRCKMLDVSRGFTLVELLIVMSITLILVFASAPIYGSLQVKAQLDETTAQTIQTLRTARENSVARYHNSAHGVYFDINAGGNDNYILYQGDSYATRDADYDRTNILESVLSFANVDLVLTGTGIDINFSEGLGKPNNIGSLNLTHDIEGAATISVNSFGKVEEE